MHCYRSYLLPGFNMTGAHLAARLADKLLITYNNLFMIDMLRPTRHPLEVDRSRRNEVSRTLGMLSDMLWGSTDDDDELQVIGDELESLGFIAESNRVREAIGLGRVAIREAIMRHSAAWPVSTFCNCGALDIPGHQCNQLTFTSASNTLACHCGRIGCELHTHVIL
jgi:hypothetical protein